MSLTPSFLEKVGGAGKGLPAKTEKANVGHEPEKRGLSGANNSSVVPAIPAFPPVLQGQQ